MPQLDFVVAHTFQCSWQLLSVFTDPYAFSGVGIRLIALAVIFVTSCKSRNVLPDAAEGLRGYFKSPVAPCFCCLSYYYLVHVELIFSLFF